MEIKQKFIAAPKPTLGSLKAGDVFIQEEKRLHDTARVAYMVCDSSFDQAQAREVRTVRLADGAMFTRGETVQVTPVKAVLTLEVPFG